jgi:asparagine N-glycosylation enzyme membrane subunit Stt3
MKPASTLKPGSPQRAGQREEDKMLWTIFVILLAMWLLGMVTSYTMGGFIHILLVLAVAAALIRIIQGRRPV